MSPLTSILITGISGFVGSHLADYILQSSPDTRIIGMIRWRSREENIVHLRERVMFEYADLIDGPSIFGLLEKTRPSVIFHLAAQSYVDYSFRVPAATLETNVVGTCNLLEAVRILKQTQGYDPTVHICSSSEVYGQVREDEIPIRETNLFRPASPYAVSKVGEDMLALQYWLSWRIRTIRTRMFTHTGPRRGDVFVLSNFAKQVAAIEVGKQETVLRVGNLQSVRTWMDVRDAVKAYWMLPFHCEPGEVYNIGGKEVFTVGEMLEQLLKLSQKKIRVEVDSARLRPSDVTLQIPSVEKFEQATGWKAEISFSKTVQDTLNYWRSYYRKEAFS